MNPNAFLAQPLLLLVTLGIVFTAFYVRATIGFGSGLISVALLTLLFPIKQVVPVVLLLDLAGSAALGAYDVRQMCLAELKWLVPASMVGVCIGSWILRQTPAQHLIAFLGVFVIAYVIYAIVVPPERLPRLAPAWALPLGLLGGASGSLYGGGGPPIVVYLQMRHLDKRSFRATFQALALLDNLARGTAYIWLGLLTMPLAATALTLAPAVVVGLLFGNWMHLRISHQTLLRATLAVLLFVGVKYLLR